jgi:branched-subunit amino acid aminotransferase/4-amino-4-deoxychorismate lyase
MTADVNTHEDTAVVLLEQARNTVEAHLHQLRDEVLDSTQLFEMRIALQDACDVIREATQHIERVQRSVEATEPAEE